jgi:hypothetical protein
MSFDHTPFLPGGTSWTAEGLANPAANLQRDPLLATLDLTPQDRAATLDRLRAVTEQNLARVVAVPPDDWGVSSEERKAVASYLWHRKDLVIELLSAEGS